jgi:hypothetical protein
VDDEELQRSSAQGYIIVRDSVTVGVCDDGSGRWCGCFVRWVQGVCLRQAQAGAYDLIGCSTGALFANSAIVSGAATIVELDLQGMSGPGQVQHNPCI